MRFGRVIMRASAGAERAGEHTNGSVRPGCYSSSGVVGTYVTVLSIHKSGYAMLSHGLRFPTKAGTAQEAVFMAVRPAGSRTWGTRSLPCHRRRSP